MRFTVFYMEMNIKICKYLCKYRIITEVAVHR